MKMISFVFVVVLSLGLSVVVLSVPPVIIAGLLAAVILGALLVLYGILSLRAKVEVAKIHAARPAPMPQQAPPVVVVPSRLVLDPVEDGRRWLARSRGDVVVLDANADGYAPALPNGVNDPGIYVFVHDRRAPAHVPVTQPRTWRVVND